MEYIIAEAASREPFIRSDGESLFCARALAPSSPKHIAISKIFENAPVSYFLKAGQYLAHYLKIETPLVFVTDWSDPTELEGLRLETDGGTIDYPKLCFFAFYTDWENLSESGIEDIFAHEFSHIWLHWLGFDFARSPSNRFHTGTAITDFFMAFSEGFAECLEIVTKDVLGYRPKAGELWDYGYDSNAWLCSRDRQLRYHAVKNNRFIYQTAIPYADDFDTYANLHMAHITSSAFTPERLKNGSQILSSEGAIASVFYQMYAQEKFKNAYLKDAFYAAFGVQVSEIDSICNLLLKILYVLSKTDLTKSTLMTDFIQCYGACFPEEKADLYELFTRTTHFATVSFAAKKLFEEMYRIGRRGDIPPFRKVLEARKTLIADLQVKLLEGQLALDAAVYDTIWITGDEEIPPTPWEPDQKVAYRFDINAATAIDFLSVRGITMDMAERLVQLREAQQGFRSLDDFLEIKNSL